jgi:heme exporter protein CcmD
MAELREILDMGQYAVFLWAGWGVSALGLGGMIAFTVIERARARARLKRAQERAGQNPARMESGGAA